jgi:succinate dehydrogenase/fumarate reductase flavoprotein subunit
MDRAYLDQVEQKIRRVMWRAAGPVRDEKNLAQGVKEIERIEQQDLQGRRVQTHDEMSRWFEVRNLVRLGRLVCFSALARKESRGQHVRGDHPARKDPEWRCLLTVSGSKPDAATRREVPDSSRAVA